jgi:N-acetylglucosaminyl-diphospho-decaprenol L-rhamnosyltransferase
MSSVDVVVVSFNSRKQLRGCVEPLLGLDDARITVVDNASSDGSVEALDGLSVEAIPLERNGGFAHGCNIGWRPGHGTYVLFLNPDARIDPESLHSLVAVLERHPEVGSAPLPAPALDVCAGPLPAPALPTSIVDGRGRSPA